MKKISLTILVFLFLAFFSGASDIQDDCDRLSRAQMQSMIEFLSADCTLEPGCVILTGTPHGVGAARVPPLYLHDGDVVEVEVEGLGVLSNRCREVRSS